LRRGLACLIGLGSLALAQPLKGQDQPGGAQLEEIVVTATRREQSVQDIPYNISVIDGDSLAASGVTSLNSLAQIVPGLQNVDTGPNTRGSNTNFSIRGLRFDPPGSSNENFRKGSVASVSTYLGETPLAFPLLLQDLERVEVLRGPQGTLYGSGSLAGTVRLIPNRPQFDDVEGRVQVRGSVTSDSGDPNGALDTVLNVPVSSALAVRLSAGYEHLGGFVDAAGLIRRQDPGDPLSPPALSVPSDPRSGFTLAPAKRDTNDSDQAYGRVTLRWQAADSLDVEAAFVHQTTEVSDAQVTNPRYEGGAYSFDSTGISPNSAVSYRAGGKYRHTAERLSPGENELNMGSLVAGADLGGASFTSSTSYYETKSSEWAASTITTQLLNPDGTVYLNYYDYFNNYPRANLTIHVDSAEETFAQEVRLVSKWQRPFDYVAGAYYQRQKYSAHIQDYEPGYTAYLEAVDGSGLPRPNGDLQYDQPREGFVFEDVAVFGELTAHLSPQWQVTGGVRYFWQDFEISPIAFNYFFDGAGTIDYDIKNRSEVDDYTFKLNTSYELTSDLLVYAVYSEGFRRGGANTAASDGPFATLPSLALFEPDTSKNYELGAKGTLFGGSLRFSLASYQIDLENFQFSAISGAGFPIIVNGKGARSRGLEFDSQIQLLRQLLLSFSYAYMDARTTDGFQIEDYIAGALLIDPVSPPTAPIAIVPADTRLPTVPEHSLNVAIDYLMPMVGAEVTFHADLGYRSSAPGFIDVDSDRYWKVPSQVLVNAQVDYSVNANWSVQLFATNITNDTAYSGAFGTQTAPNPWAGRYVVRPRTVGLGLKCAF
jgi:outer membrane receptor protein involved in Fe transport